MTGALSAAASICASLRGDCTELEATHWHSSRVAISYTRSVPPKFMNFISIEVLAFVCLAFLRFLVVVLSAYKQIRAQRLNVLADIEEDNFDKAFEFLRPGKRFAKIATIASSSDIENLSDSDSGRSGDGYAAI